MCAAEFSSRQALSTSGVCHFTFIKLPITVSHSGPQHAFVSLPINIFLYQRIAFLAQGAFVGHGFWVCMCNCLCVCVHIVKSCFCKHTVSVERLNLCDSLAQTIDEDITRRHLWAHIPFCFFVSLSQWYTVPTWNITPGKCSHTNWEIEKPVFLMTCPMQS